MGGGGSSGWGLPLVPGGHVESSPRRPGRAARRSAHAMRRRQGGGGLAWQRTAAFPIAIIHPGPHARTHTDSHTLTEAQLDPPPLTAGRVFGAGPSPLPRQPLPRLGRPPAPLPGPGPTMLRKCTGAGPEPTANVGDKEWNLTDIDGRSRILRDRARPRRRDHDRVRASPAAARKIIESPPDWTRDSGPGPGPSPSGS